MTPRIPGCSYRLQLNKNFNFRDATALVDYLDALGVTDVYASPFLVARPGSVHGYDVVDQSRLNPEIGTDEGPGRARRGAEAARGMGLIMDVVPNHMCIASSDNHWWNDVLENGRSSPYAAFFDIDWHPPKSELAREGAAAGARRTVRPRPREAGARGSATTAGAFHAHYWSIALSDRAAHHPAAAGADRDRSAPQPSADHPDVLEIESIVTAPSICRPAGRPSPSRCASACARRRSSSGGSTRWCRAAPPCATRWSAASPPSTASKGNPRSFDALEALLGEQAYRLALLGRRRRGDQLPPLLRHQRPGGASASSCRTCSTPCTTRRSSCCARQGDRAARSTTSTADGSAPLPRAAAARLRRRADGRTRRAGRRAPACRLYVVVEKILTGDEALPPEWPVHGTTGYEFLNVVNGLFVDAGGARAIERALPAASREGRGEFDDLFYRREAADPAHRDVGRALRARAPARSHLRAAPLVARLHARTACTWRSPR